MRITLAFQNYIPNEPCLEYFTRQLVCKCILSLNYKSKIYNIIQLKSPISQIIKLRLREPKLFARGHSTSQWRSQNLNSDLLTSNCGVFPTMLTCRSLSTCTRSDTKVYTTTCSLFCNFTLSDIKIVSIFLVKFTCLFICVEVDVRCVD